MLADGVLRRSSGRLDPSRRCANELLTRTGDQRGPRVKDGEQLLGIGLTGGDDVGHDSGDGEIQGRGNKLGEPPGLEAELFRGSGGAWARRSVVPVAAQSRDAAEQAGFGG